MRICCPINALIEVHVTSALAWDFMTEVLLALIAVGGLFPGSALLRWSGGSFNDEERARDPQTRGLIVLLHGLGGQEGQYCMGRIHLALADSHTPLPPVVSLNYHTEGKCSTEFGNDQNLQAWRTTSQDY